MIALILLLWLAAWTPATYFDIAGRYSYKEVVVDKQSYPYPMHLRSIDLANNSTIYSVDLLMLSRSYSAQYPIRVDVVGVRQLNGTAENKDLYIVFPHSDNPPPHKEEEKPESFGYFGGVVFHLDLPRNTTWYNNTSSYAEPYIQYAMQGCYNVAVTTTPAYFRDHDPFKYDCTELNIASLEATSALKINDAQAAVTNSALKLASDTLRVSDLIFGLTVIGVFIAMMELVRRKGK